MPEDRALAWQRMGASSGIVSPIFGFTCILTAIISHSGFSWTRNALSDLGVMSGVTGPIFNFGLFASGLLAFNFAVFSLLTYFRKTWVGKIGTATFAAGALALIFIGAINENFSPAHYLVSLAFFALMPIAMFITACTFLIVHQTRMAVFTFLIGLAAALPWILQFIFNYVPNVAIPEFLSGLAMSIWTVALSYKMLKQAKVN